jgi:hypothetical protein
LFAGELANFKSVLPAGLTAEMDVFAEHKRAERAAGKAEKAHAKTAKGLAFAIKEDQHPMKHARGDEDEDEGGGEGDAAVKLRRTHRVGKIAKLMPPMPPLMPL